MFAIQELLEKAVEKAILGKVTYQELQEMLELLYEEKSGKQSCIGGSNGRYQKYY